MTALQAFLHGPRDLHIEKVNLDPDGLSPHQVLVDTEVSALKIGTDRGNYEGADYGMQPIEYPRPVGDSCVGIVRAIGAAVTRVKVGDRVADRAPHSSAHVFDERAHLAKVPPGVNPEDAVWSHLYTLSGFCYRKALFEPGENVAVVGLGVLGLGAVALGPLLGARTIAIGNSSLRLEMATRMGAHAAFLSSDDDLQEKLNRFTDGIGIDLVILTANPWPAYRTSVEIVRNGGRVSIVSLLGRGEEHLNFNPLVLDWFYDKGISLIAVNGMAGYRFPGDPEDQAPSGARRTDDSSESLSRSVSSDRFSWNNSCAHVLSLMADGGLEPKRLITHRLPYHEMKKAYEMAYHREKEMLGVVFDWRDV